MMIELLCYNNNRKASLYALTACSAACLVRMDGLTPPLGLSPGEKQIYILCTQSVVEKYFVRVSTLLKDYLVEFADGRN